MTKHDLMAYRDMSEEVKQIRYRLDELTYRLTAPGIAHINGVAVQTSGNGGLGSAVIAKMALEELYAEKIDALVKMLTRIEHAIEVLPPELRVIMRDRYIDGRRWEDICAERHYSWHWIHELHRRALSMIN